MSRTRMIILLLALSMPSHLAADIRAPGHVDPALTLLPYWINSGLDNRDLTLSPDGNTLFSTLMAPAAQFSVIVTSMRIDGVWQTPTVAPFSGQYPDIEPMFSVDGRQLFFSSRRPRNGGEAVADWDIWVTAMSNGQWQTPVNIGPPVNTEGDEFYPSQSREGHLYFTSGRDKGYGAEDLYRAIFDQGQWTRVENLGPGVNSAAYEFNAFIDPDERYLIFGSQGRPGEIGGGDLYVSYRDESGQFAAAQLLPAPVNSGRLDYCPFVWGDSLYFTTRRFDVVPRVNTYEDAEQLFSSPGNGLGDIYSVPVRSVLGL